MRQVQVCLSPALLPFYNLEGKTVVVTDVLRATSTMVAALELGVKKIIPVESREKAKQYIQQPGYIVAGERDGKKVNGFDLGNSPLLLKKHKDLLTQNILVMTTTNGTKAIKAAESATAIYIGALTNVAAVARQLSKEEQDVVVLCAGWKNRVNLEDTLFAGALCQALENNKEIYGDAALMSKQLFALHKNQLYNAIKNATHYKRLKSHGIEDDIQYCMQLNTVELLPIYRNGEIIVQQ